MVDILLQKNPYSIFRKTLYLKIEYADGLAFCPPSKMPTTCSIVSSFSCKDLDSEIEQKMYTAYGHVADILSTLVKEPNCKVNYEFLMSVLPASLCEEERGIPLGAVEKEIHSLSSIPYEGICSVQTGTEDHIVRENRRLEFELKVARENLEEMGMTYRAILGKCEDMQKDLELLNNIKHFLNATAEKQALPVVNFYSTNAFTAQEVNLLRQIPKQEFPLLFEAVQEKHKQPEAFCMAMTEDDYQDMLKDKAATEAKNLAKEAERAGAKGESPIALSNSSSTLDLYRDCDAPAAEKAAEAAGRPLNPLEAEALMNTSLWTLCEERHALATEEAAAIAAQSEQQKAARWAKQLEYARAHKIYVTQQRAAQEATRQRQEELDAKRVAAGEWVPGMTTLLKPKAITEASTPVLETPPEVILQVRAERPDYNHKNWPSPRTKRIAKQIASTLISSSGSWYDGPCPKSIKTHEDALNYLAKHAKISVEDLLKISEDEYKSTYATYSIVYG